MRLHRLRITAFGPFPGTEEVDFDALSESGLFLINGPTGAGKTSVLDAVCFALYGQVPSVRNDVKELRSDHAPPGGAPSVSLEATIRGRRLRIVRSPAWRRPKKRGQGTTEEKAKVSVEEREGGGWIVRATRHDEAGHFVGNLLGMTKDQFCQVVLLPQGDFAAFLRAGADERRKVLERLFATEIYARVESVLAEQRRETAREAEAFRDAAESDADQLAAVAIASRPDAEPDALAGWGVELCAHLADVRAAAEACAIEADALLGTARSAAERGRRLVELRRRRADAERRRDRLAERAPERAALAAALDAAIRADRVLPLAEAVTARAARAEEASRAAGAARAALTGLVSGDADIETLRKEERSRRDEVAGLDQLRGDAVRLREIEAEIRRADGALEACQAREAALSALLGELPARRDGLRSALAEARSLLAARPAAEAAYQAGAARLAAAERRDALSAELAAADDEYRLAVDAAQEARDRLQEIRRARLDGMAASLAEHLSEGAPCPVCGSPDHPAPAAAAGPLTGEDDEVFAGDAYEAARNAREEAGARVGRVRAELDAEVRVAGDAEAGDLRAELTEALARRAELDAAEERVARLETDSERIEADLEEARDGHNETVTAITEATEHRRGLAADAGRVRARIDAARGPDATLERRAERLAREAEKISAAAEAIERARIAVEELAAARATATEAAAAEGFGSPEEARAAALPERERAELAARARELDAEDAAVGELLTEPEPSEPAPDQAVLEEALAAAEAACGLARSASDRARQRHERLTELAARLRARADAWRPAGARHSLVRDLSSLVEGTSSDNRPHMRLSAYVLAARLEQVVAAANDRLARMSAGRYALEHTVERAAGDRKRSGGGLGLRIVDAWTGVAREPATLSGGESFVTSLALALGLADVVTAEAGGAEIGTLFVDEGFGTLDEETLDEVMAVLDGLREGGRAVGIVSHVAELRIRVPAQLRVRKGRTGSTVSVTV